MVRFIVVLYLIILFSSCSKDKFQTTIILDKAAELIEMNPDSSLTILNTLKLDNLSISAERARYALLKSMALDKNFIDVTNDSLTSIALLYYKKHGTPDEKLKAYYYNCIVYLNAEDYENALDNCLTAEKYVDKCIDYVSIGRLYNTKMIIYSKTLNLENAIKPAELSAHYYLTGKDTTRYITALNNLSSMHLGVDDYESLSMCLNNIKAYEDRMTLKQKGNYYVNLINYYVAMSNPEVYEVIDKYITSYSGHENSIKWHIIIKAYLEKEDVESAYKTLIKSEEFDVKSNRNIYHLRASDVYNAIGDYKKAYENLKIYQKTSNGMDYKLLNSDVQFLEERYNLQIKQLKNTYSIIILTLSLVIMIMILAFLSKYIKRLNKKRIEEICEMEEQKAFISNQYEKALLEKEKLKKFISNNSLDKNIKKVIEQRLEILNGFIVSNISGVNMDKCVKDLKLFLNNNSDFMRTTRLSFEMTHPKFISYLEKNDLSEWEIGCCCLYCIGLNGNEIANYLDIKYFYKKSSLIRGKLGVQSENIHTYLLKKMNELR